MSNSFGKIDIVKRIGKKINNTIQKRLLNDIIDLITDFISDEVSANRVFSVNKFGTFHQATVKPRLVWSRLYQRQVMTKPNRKFKFSPHVVFSNLLKDKRKNIIEALKTEK